MPSIDISNLTRRSIDTSGLTRTEQAPSAPAVIPESAQAIIKEEQAKRESVGLVEKIKHAWRVGEHSHELGSLLYQDLVTQGTTPSLQKKIKATQDSMPLPIDDRQVGQGLIERGLTGLTEIAPTAIRTAGEGVKRGLVTGAAGATAAAVAGQIPPLTGAPEEIFTVPTAFAAMYSVGAVSGTIDAMRKIEAGLAYGEILDLEDEHGNRINPAVAKAAAHGVGVINGLLEFSQINTLLKTIPGGDKILSGAIRETTKRLINSGTIQGIALKYAGKYATFLGAQTAQEIAQESTNVAAAELAKIVTGSLGQANVPLATRKEITDRLKQTAIDSALAFGVGGLPGTTFRAAREIRTVGASFTQKPTTLIDEIEADSFVEDIQKPDMPIAEAEEILSSDITVTIAAGFLEGESPAIRFSAYVGTEKRDFEIPMESEQATMIFDQLSQQQKEAAVESWLKTRAQNAVDFQIQEGVLGGIDTTVAEAIEKGEPVVPVLREALEVVRKKPLHPREQEAADNYEKYKDLWFADKDEDVIRAQVEKRIFQRFIMAASGDTSKVRGVPAYGEKSKDFDRAIQIYIDSKRNPDHIEKFKGQLTEEQQRIVDLSQNLPDNVREVADEIEASYKQLGMQSRDADVIHNVLEHYVGRIWDIEGKLTGEGRKFATKTRHAKARKFDTIIEGWANGFNLKVEGATNTLQVIKEELTRTMHDKKFLKSLTKLKTVDGKPLVTTEGIARRKGFEDYEEIKHRNMNQWTYAGKIDYDPDDHPAIGDKVRIPDSRTTGKILAIDDTDPNNVLAEVAFKDTEGNEVSEMIPMDQIRGRVVLPRGTNFVVTKDGTILEQQRMYAPKEIAKDLNNILGRSTLEGPTIEAITKFNAHTKAWILQSSFFHHLAFGRSFYLGTNKKKWGEMNAITAYKQGMAAIESLQDEIVLGVRNGLTLGLKQDWDETILAEKTFIGKVLDKTGATREVKDTLLRLRKMQADFLFGEFGAGLKAKSFLIEYRNETKKHPNEDPNVIAKRVASLINDDFGGLHLQRLGRNPTTQHIFRIFALAPDWTESNIRSMVKTISPLRKVDGKWTKTVSKEELELYRSFWIGILWKGMAATALTNFLMAGGDIDEMAENYEKAWESGNYKWLKVDVTPLYKMFGGDTQRRKYFSILGHFNDPLKFFNPKTALRAAHHKSSVFGSAIHEARSGADWAGRKFTTLEELIETKETVKFGPGAPLNISPTSKDSQFYSFLVAQLIGTQPIQVQNLVGWLSGEMEGFDAVTNSLGLGVTSTYEPEKKRR